MRRRLHRGSKRDSTNAFKVSFKETPPRSSGHLKKTVSFRWKSRESAAVWQRHVLIDFQYFYRVLKAEEDEAILISSSSERGSPHRPEQRAPSLSSPRQSEKIARTEVRQPAHIVFLRTSQIVSKFHVFLYCVIKDARVCPACGFSNENVNVIREHTFQKHAALITDKKGVNEFNAKCFWRAKRGTRRISKHTVEFFLEKYQIFQDESCGRVLQCVTEILKLCLVEIANDSQCKNKKQHYYFLFLFVFRNSIFFSSFHRIFGAIPVFCARTSQPESSDSKLTYRRGTESDLARRVCSGVLRGPKHYVGMACVSPHGSES